MAVEAAGAVLTERDGAVLVLTMNRPDRLNALARPLREAMHAALVDAMGDDGVRAIVLTGAGRAFSAGGDLDELTTVDDLSAEVRQGFNPLARFLAEGPKPVVAAINGPAAGAGFGLALCCDLRVMADDAFVAVAFAGIGLVPDTGVSWTLPRLVGPSRAYDLAVTGRRVQAEEAERIGLADRVVPRDEVVRLRAARRRPGPRPARRPGRHEAAAARVNRPHAGRGAGGRGGHPGRRSRARRLRGGRRRVPRAPVAELRVTRSGRPHILVVENPVASGVTPASERIVMDALRPYAEIDVVRTERPLHARDLAHQAVEDGLDAVIVFAGDGTANEVLNGVAGRLPVGALPAGGTSVLPRAAGLPRRLEPAARRSPRRSPPAASSACRWGC